MANQLLLNFAAGLQRENDALAGFAQSEYTNAPIGMPAGGVQGMQGMQLDMPPSQPSPAGPPRGENVFDPNAPDYNVNAPRGGQPRPQPPASPPAGGFNSQGMTDPAMTAWGRLGEAWGQPLSVTSAYRSPEHNERVGGARRSQHMHGNAFDIDVRHLNTDQRRALIQEAQRAGFNGIGIYENSLHFDVGGRRAWGPDYSRNSVPEWARDVAFGGPDNVTMSTKGGAYHDYGGQDHGEDEQPREVSKFDKFLERLGLGPADDPDPDDDEYPVTGRERLGNMMEVLSQGFQTLSSGQPLDISDIIKGQSERRSRAMTWLEQRRERRKAEEDLHNAQETYAEMYPQYADLARAGPQGLQLAVRIAEIEDNQEHERTLHERQAAASMAEAQFNADRAMERLERTEAGETTRLGTRLEHETSERIGTQTYSTVRGEDQQEHDISMGNLVTAREELLQNRDQSHAIVMDERGVEHTFARDELLHGYDRTMAELNSQYNVARDNNNNTFQAGENLLQRFHDLTLEEVRNGYITTRDSIGHERQVSVLELEQNFADRMGRLGRQHDLLRDKNGRLFAAEQGEVGRTHDLDVLGREQNFATIRGEDGQEHEVDLAQLRQKHDAAENERQRGHEATQADAQVGRNVDQATQIADAETARQEAAEARQRSIDEQEKAAMIERIRQNPSLGDMADLFEPLDLQGARDLYRSITNEDFKFNREQAAETAESVAAGEAIAEAYADKPWGATAGRLASRNPEAATRYIEQRVDADITADEQAAEQEAGSRIADNFASIADSYAESSPETARAISEAAELARSGDLETAAKRFLEATETGTDVENLHFYEELLHSTSPERAATFASIIGNRAGIANPSQAAVLDLQVGQFKAEAEKIQNATSQIEQLGIASELLFRDEFASGPLNRALLTPFTALRELGINLRDTDTLTSQEVFNAVAEGAIAYMRVPGDIMSDQDVTRYRNSTVSLGKTPEANALTIYALTETTKRREAKYRAELAYFALNNGDMEGSDAYINDRLSDLGMMTQNEDGSYTATPMMQEFEYGQLDAETINNMPQGTPYYITRDGADVLMVRGMNDISR